MLRRVGISSVFLVWIFASTCNPDALQIQARLANSVAVAGNRALPLLVDGAPPSLVDPARPLPLNESDQFGVVAWPWKLLVRREDNLAELYDLESDWGETTDRAPHEPSRVAELQAAGVRVAFGHDCVMDPWYALGSGDMLEVASMGLHVAQMTSVQGQRQCFDAVTVNNAHILGLEGYGLDVGSHERAGGDRHGVFASLNARALLGGGWLGELSWQYQNWAGAQAYSPGLIDVARRQHTQLTRATLWYELTKQQALYLEYRGVRNREAVEADTLHQRDLVVEDVADGTKLAAERVFLPQKRRG